MFYCVFIRIVHVEDTVWCILTRATSIRREHPDQRSRERGERERPYNVEQIADDVRAGAFVPVAEHLRPRQPLQHNNNTIILL